MEKLTGEMLQLASRKRKQSVVLLDADGTFLGRLSTDQVIQLLRDDRVAATGTKTRLRCLRLKQQTMKGVCGIRSRNWELDTEIATTISRNLAKRRTEEKSAPGSHTQLEWLNLLVKFGNKCVRCNVNGEDVPLTKDHVTPLVDGGSHFISNIQPLCRSCNSWKSDRDIDFRPAALRNQTAA